MGDVPPDEPPVVPPVLPDGVDDDDEVEGLFASWLASSADCRPSCGTENHSTTSIETSPEPGTGSGSSSTGWGAVIPRNRGPKLRPS